MASANLFLWFIQVALMLNSTFSVSHRSPNNTIESYRRPPGSGFRSLQDVPDCYRGLFYTLEEMNRIRGQSTFLQKPIYSHIAHLRPTTSGNSIPDSNVTRLLGCCTTLQFFNTNRTLKNRKNVVRFIVQLDTPIPPRYQYIMNGICEQTGDVNGHTCTQGYVYKSLLVYTWRFDRPFEFDIFEIPSFCFCT